MIAIFTPSELMLVLMLCCGGYRLCDIARLLKRSYMGVMRDFQYIYEKTGMHSETELIAWFYRDAL